jgi:hypothetical protein
MFLRFTKFSRPKLGFVIALVMLFAPALIVTTVESAPQKGKKTAPTPKKKQAATPAKKTQSKTKPTPTPKNAKTNSKKDSQTASKNKKDARRSEKPTTSKNDRRTADKNSKNSKQSLTSKNRIPSKNAKDDRRSKNDRNSRSDRNSRDDDRNRSRERRTERTADRNKPTPKNTKTADVRTKNRPATKNRTETRTAENDKPDVKTPGINTTDLPQIIVTSFSVPVRSQANANASTVSSVKLGTVLRVTEKNPAWYRVQYSANGVNSTGWISANAVNDLNASGKTELYRQIVERNYKPQMDFESAAEFYEFLSSVGGDLDTSDKSAEIELKRLLALRSALRTIPADKRDASPYSTFIKNREREIVYNEPAGEWLVVSNEFWNLHTKYKKSAFADTIAWEAANNPLPGECEGYVNCYLFDMRMRFGEYLNLHPNGTRAGEALQNMTAYLSPLVADAQQKTVYTGPTDVTDRAEFNNLIAELRTIVARLQFVEKEKTLQQLRTIAEAYR